MMNNIYNIQAINNHMSLRLPQYESLLILDDLMQTLDFTQDNEELQKQIHEKYPLFRKFERDFPSLAFALATGVGKTMLMGAFITYLYTNHGIKNFFIIAPNLTVYNKLIKDFGHPNFKKYVFKRINVFNQKLPLVITGDNYQDNNPAQHNALENSININIFNIGKINNEVRGDNIPQVKRLSEYIGQSYFDYLKNLPDLVVLMDESHHYRAARGMAVINELDPFLGLELTATPQIESTKGAVKFKNVVYEYSLAKAINDGFVKEPAAATRKTMPYGASDYEIDQIKIKDGLRIHRNTIAELQAYAENEDTNVVKPFVLVVCKDTAHAAEVREYICSKEVYNGDYADKVIEVHSNQKGNEKDENIQQLLSLEDGDNKIEIVIHVNMLKEGWDVTNLYTIIPLRTATSLTLREQTIGRGLRLPYGKRTGNKDVDLLTIVAHDKFEEIIKAASDENSIIRKENILSLDDEDGGKEKEVVKPPTTFVDYINQKEKKLKHARSDDKKKSIIEDIETAKAVGLAIDEVLSKPANIAIPVDSIEESSQLIQGVITTRDLSKPEVVAIIKEKALNNLEQDGQITFDIDNVDKKIETAIAPMIEQKVRYTIDIPDIAIVQANTQVKIYNHFDLETMLWLKFTPPNEDILIETLKSNETSILQGESDLVLPDSPANIIINEMLNIEKGLDFGCYEDLLYKLAHQAIEFVGDDEKTLYHHKKEIARLILEQLNHNSELTDPEYQVKLFRASTPILQQDYTKYKEDDIVKYTTNIPAYEIKKKVVGHFQKACHTAYKFDSVPEHIFTVILEREKKVEKWLRPARGQFKIHTNGIHAYQPDFVVETIDTIYIVEIKAHNRTEDDDVKIKAKAAREYCNNVNTVYAGTDKKPWKYMLLVDKEVTRNSDFSYLERESQRHWMT